MGAGAGDDIEGWVGDIIGNYAVNSHLGATVSQRDILKLRLKLLGQMPQKGIRRLVVVMIGVINRIVDLVSRLRFAVQHSCHYGLSQKT